MLKKTFLIITQFLFFFNLYAELFEIKIDRNDADLKNKISMYDILSGSHINEKETVYIIEASHIEIMQLNGIAEINEIANFISVEPEYSDLEDINRRIDKAVSNSNGDVKSYIIGKSVEGRDIRAVKITKTEKSDDMPEILFVGLHHAREWISSEVTLGILEFLVANRDSNPFVSNILENSVIWFVPMLNPDGYLFSFEEARMWRYNRRVHPDESIGVDLNRNYDSSWIKIDYVHGEGPFSEPETQAVRNLILNSFEEPIPDGIKSLDGLITYHSYGQIIMYPPGSTEEPAKKHEYYKKLAEKMSSLAFSECGSVYIVMQNSSLYYTFGEMTEWFMNTHDGKPSFTFELRPHMGSDYFFMLPAEQIRDSIKENITPALYFARHVISGETELVMDMDYNGKNDVIENTLFDYKCDRSDLENDTDPISDNDINETYESDLNETNDESNDKSNSPDDFSDNSSGCVFLFF